MGMFSFEIYYYYSNITLIQNCYWFVDEKATNRLNDSPSAVQTSLPLFIFQQIPEVLFLKGQNNFMGEGFGPRAKQKIAKALGRGVYRTWKGEERQSNELCRHSESRIWCPHRSDMSSLHCGISTQIVCRRLH